MNIACWSRAALVALLVQLAARCALAQVSPAEASCPSVREWVASSADAADAPSTVQVRTTGGPSHWLATLSVRYANGSAGTRQLSARSCAELERAVAVTLSLLESGAPLADPPVSPPSPVSPPAQREPVAAADGAARAAPARPRAAPPVVAPPVVAPVVAALAPPGRLASSTEDAGPERDGLEPDARSLHGFLRVSSLLAVAGSRFGELGAALAGGLWLGSYGARAELSARRPLASVPATHGFSLQLQRYAAAFEPCVRRRGAVDWAVCSGPRLEWVRGLALGPSDPAPDQVWLPGWGGGTWLRLPLSDSWALSAGLQASWSLRRAQASVAPWGKVYELPRLGSSLLLGAEWAL
ncbi:MAG: hypothetical protein ABI895_18035 [Deltaproteobacteria bacterium]